MSNSPLVVYTKLSPNHSGKRTKKIDTITIHCIDVYKRQTYDIEIVYYTTPKSEAEVIANVEGTGGAIDRYNAVSYTHLDVYKRQLNKFMPTLQKLMEQITPAISKAVEAAAPFVDEFLTGAADALEDLSLIHISAPQGRLQHPARPTMGRSRRPRGRGHHALPPRGLRHPLGRHPRGAA